MELSYVQMARHKVKDQHPIDHHHADRGTLFSLMGLWRPKRDERWRDERWRDERWRDERWRDERW